jgi:eukaryotic-like serine/threonine-protein kinase
MESYGTVGRYQLVKPLAQGGMAEIFLARQEGPAGFGKTVVVKRILSHLASDSGFVEMFLDEARLAAQLSHPNIVQMFDFGEDDGSYYQAMEYLAGEDLSSIIRQAKTRGRPIPPQIAALICSHACEGLNYAHTLPGEDGEPLGIVHRDVSPSNIMVTYQGAVKVLDFGIAKAAGKIVKTEVGTVKGKFMYMSPEQAHGKEIDGRSDVFALGAVMYEMLTGIRLFQRENQLATLMAVTEQPIPSPRQHRPDLLPELEDVVMRALERDVNGRYSSCQSMREALDEFLAMRTYAPSHVQLRQYLIDLFGQEHVAERSRAPVTSAGGTPPSGAARLTPASGSHRTGSNPSVRIATGASKRPGSHQNAPSQPAAAAAAPPPAALGDDDDLATRISDGLKTEARAPSHPPTQPRAEKAARPFDADPPKRKVSMPVLLGAGGGVALLVVVAVIWLAEGAAEDQARQARPVSGAVTSPHRDPLRPPPPSIPPTTQGQRADGTPAEPDPTPPEPVAQVPAPDPEPEPVTPPPAPEPEAVAKAPEPAEPPPARPPRRPPPEPAPEPVAEAPVAPVTKQPARPPRRPPPPPAAETGPGTLMVNCIPWCRIYVNGSDTGRTSPARDIELRAGRHELKLVHPPTGAERTQSVEIKAGEETVAVIRF